MNYITTPNIPAGRVRLAAVSETAVNVISALNREGIEVVRVEALKELPVPVAAHSDLQILHLGSNIILSVYEGGASKQQLTKIGFTVWELFTKLGGKYPQDISLNFLLLNNCCFGLSSVMPLQLIQYCNHAGLQIITSKQGYARCSVAVVGQHAAITSDTTLYKLLTAAEIDTLLVGCGDILLPGYATGFIGGCCGLISNDCLAFTGSLENYRYGAEVLKFLHKYNVTAKYLTNGKLLDVGGILPLMEEARPADMLR